MGQHTHLVFHSSVDLLRFFRAALCFSSSLFFSALARSVETSPSVKNRHLNRDTVTSQYQQMALVFADSTDVSDLHGADVGSEAAVGQRDDSLHALLQLVQVHGECGERVELEERRTTRRGLEQPSG